MDRFAFRGMTVAYERSGSGPVVMFLHNGGTSSAIWRSQMAALASTNDVIGVDLPGFGRSTTGGDKLTLDDYVDMVVALIEEFGPEPAVIVGNCMGSNIASGVAERRPDLVRALVLINPLTAATFDAGWLGWLHRMERFTPRTTKLFRSVSRRIRVPRFVAPLVVRFQLGPVGVERGIHHDPDLIACNLRSEQLPALIDVLDDMDSYGVLDRGRKLGDVPILTLWGARNHVLSPRRGDDLDESLDPITKVRLDGSGHLPMLEQPELVTDAITEFLEGVGHLSRSSSDEVVG